MAFSADQQCSREKNYMAQVGKDCNIPWVLLGIQLLYEAVSLKPRQVRKFSSHYMWLNMISRTKNSTKVWNFLIGRSKPQHLIVLMVTVRQVLFLLSLSIFGVVQDSFLS